MTFNPDDAFEEIDFGDTQEASEFPVATDGDYILECVKVEAIQTKEGKPGLNLHQKIVSSVDGDDTYKNVHVFDRVYWHSDKLKGRLKHILKAYGHDVSGKLKVSRDAFLSRFVVCEVRSEENNKGRMNNVATYAGYKRHDGPAPVADAAAPIAADEIPF